MHWMFFASEDLGGPPWISKKRVVSAVWPVGDQNRITSLQGREIVLVFTLRRVLQKEQEMNSFYYPKTASRPAGSQKQPQHLIWLQTASTMWIENKNFKCQKHSFTLQYYRRSAKRNYVWHAPSTNRWDVFSGSQFCQWIWMHFKQSIPSTNLIETLA